jgi:hypothetical protein
MQHFELQFLYLKLVLFTILGRYFLPCGKIIFSLTTGRSFAAVSASFSVV